MSFINDSATVGTVYAPGWFLANNEDCTRHTREISAEDSRVKTANGGKYMPMGSIYPANDATAEGIVYEDVDVSSGNMPGSVVLSGVVYENRLPAEIASAAKTALEGKGFVFITEPEVTRPY